MSTQREPVQGDVIWADRAVQGKPYYHCGIYEGAGYVIHFAAPEGSEISQENAVIHRTTIDIFRDGCPIKIVEFPQEPGKTVFDAEETLRRARSRIGEREYDFAGNNCDHFATWCKTGEHRSLQADEFKKELKALGPAGEIVCTIHDFVETFRKYQLEERESAPRQMLDTLEINSHIADTAPPDEGGMGDNDVTIADYEIIDEDTAREAETALKSESEDDDAAPSGEAAPADEDAATDAAATDAQNEGGEPPPEKKPWYERASEAIKNLTFPIAAGLTILKQRGIPPFMKLLPSPARISALVRNGIDKVVGFIKVIAGVFTPAQARQETRLNQTALLGDVIGAKQTQPVGQVVKQVFGRVGTAVKHTVQNVVQRLTPIRTAIKTAAQRVGHTVVNGIKAAGKVVGGFFSRIKQKVFG